MTESSDITEQIERLEKMFAELSQTFGKLSRANELNLQLVLLFFQCSQRAKNECVSSLRLMANHSTFMPAAPRQQVLDQIARCEMESELMTELLSGTLSKLRSPPRRAAPGAPTPV
jgi:hypothetical protein